MRPSPLQRNTLISSEPCTHFSSNSISYAACRSSFFFPHAPKYISAHAQQAKAVSYSLLCCSPEEHHSKETHFLLEREVGFLSFSVPGTLVALSLSLHTGCQGKFTLLYPSNYPRNVCVRILCVKSFSLQLSLIFWESAIAVCYTKIFLLFSETIHEIISKAVHKIKFNTTVEKLWKDFTRSCISTWSFKLFLQGSYTNIAVYNYR